MMSLSFSSASAEAAVVSFALVMLIAGRSWLHSRGRHDGRRRVPAAPPDHFYAAFFQVDRALETNQGPPAEFHVRRASHLKAHVPENVPGDRGVAVNLEKIGVARNVLLQKCRVPLSLIHDRDQLFEKRREHGRDLLRILDLDPASHLLPKSRESLE